jgi:hypothetical protein
MSTDDEIDALVDAAASSPFADAVSARVVELSKHFAGVPLREVMAACAFSIIQALEQAQLEEALAPALAELQMRLEAFAAALLTSDVDGAGARKH